MANQTVTNEEAGHQARLQAQRSIEQQGLEETEETADSQREEQELKEIYDEGKSFGHPSRLKYGILFFLAGTSDFAKWLELTGIGYVAVLIIVGICFLLSIFICLLTNTKAKKAQDYVKKLQERMRHIAKNSVRAVRWGTRILGAEKLASKVAGNPTMKVILGEGIDLIPVINLFNLSVVWVYIAYRQEKSLYRHAANAADTIT